MTRPNSDTRFSVPLMTRVTISENPDDIIRAANRALHIQARPDIDMSHRERLQKREGFHLIAFIPILLAIEAERLEGEASGLLEEMQVYYQEKGIKLKSALTEKGNGMYLYARTTIDEMPIPAKAIKIIVADFLPKLEERYCSVFQGTEPLTVL